MTHPMLRTLLIVGMFAAAVATATAQSITLSLSISPQPSPYFSDWASRQETAVLTVYNPAGTPFQAKLRAGLTQDGNPVAITNNAKMPVRTISTPTAIFRAEDLIPFNAVDFYGDAMTTAAKTSMLPAGVYQLCVMLLNPDDTPLTQEVCGSLQVTDYQGPVLLTPDENAEVQQGTYPTFRWTPLSPTPFFAVQYRLLVFEILNGQQPMQALNNAPIVSKEIAGLTTMIWPPEFQLPGRVPSYLWTVKTTDDRGNPIGVDKGFGSGFAEPRTFTVPDGSSTGTGLPLANAVVYVSLKPDGQPGVVCTSNEQGWVVFTTLADPSSPNRPVAQFSLPLSGTFFFEIWQPATVAPPGPWRMEKVFKKSDGPPYSYQLLRDPSASGVPSLLGMTQSATPEAPAGGGGCVIPRMTDQERDAVSNPQPDMLIFNTTTNLFNIYKNTGWFELNTGNCLPKPTTALAGPDQSISSGTTATLAGNTPVVGNGEWSIVSGTGGSFASTTDPHTQFTGSSSTHVLRWTITACSASTDDVRISFQSCNNTVKDGSETGVDCGGPNCPKCGNGLPCLVNGDCTSGNCTAGKCAAPTCMDVIKNGTETDVDCGGTCSQKCADAKNCLVGSDCASGLCVNGKCISQGAPPPPPPPPGPCPPGYANCDGDASNGCETNTTTVTVSVVLCP